MMNRKIRFALIGSGWRAMYYVRIAKALPHLFEMCMMLCRTEEKAQYMRDTYQIRTSVNEQELIDEKPDFIVIAAYKNDNLSLSMKWMKKGFHVIQETPAAMDPSGIAQLKNCQDAQTKLIIAEQYLLYPENTARMNLIRKELIGPVHYLCLSLAHEYHAASMMRHFLNIPCDMPFAVDAEEYTFPAVRTLSRYERYTDGSVSETKRVLARFVFENGKVCLYDFDSEQYRSPIRSSHCRIQGTYGEIDDDIVLWLDENHEAHREMIRMEERTVITDDPNPNLHEFSEVTSIAFQKESLYEPPFGLCGLSQDETAIAQLLMNTYLFILGKAAHPYPLQEALADSSMAILMKEAIESGKPVQSSVLSIK